MTLTSLISCVTYLISSSNRIYGSSSTSRTGLAGCCVWTELYSRAHGWSRGSVVWKGKSEEKTLLKLWIKQKVHTMLASQTFFFLFGQEKQTVETLRNESFPFQLFRVHQITIKIMSMMQANAFIELIEIITKCNRGLGTSKYSIVCSSFWKHGRNIYKNVCKN